MAFASRVIFVAPYLRTRERMIVDGGKLTGIDEDMPDLVNFAIVGTDPIFGITTDGNIFVKPGVGWHA